MLFRSQQALENLKATREALSTGVRTLTGEEQPANMLGAEPEAGGMDDLEAPVEPDAMNAAPEGDIGDEFAAAEPAAGGMDDLEGPVEPDAMNAEPEGDIGDEFAAAEPATGGAEAAGREQRENINYGSRLLKVLAG